MSCQKAKIILCPVCKEPIWDLNRAVKTKKGHIDPECAYSLAKEGFTFDRGMDYIEKTRKLSDFLKLFFESMPKEDRLSLLKNAFYDFYKKECEKCLYRQNRENSALEMLLNFCLESPSDFLLWLEENFLI